MRLILIGLCVFMAACSSESFSSPTSPASTGIASPATTGPASPASSGVGLAQTRAQAAAALPFRGSFTAFIDVPPPSAHATAEGTATHLGRFTGILTAEVYSDNTSTGTFSFTAANGDQLSGTFIGIEGIFIPPNTARITEVATIKNGTGRFAGATGTFTMVRVDTIDFATNQATARGTFEGEINLNK